jgi:hypothetical protein
MFHKILLMLFGCANWDWDQKPQGMGCVAPASWSAVMSEANHRFGFGLMEFSSSTCQSGDCADSIAAVQNLAELS